LFGFFIKSQSNFADDRYIVIAFERPAEDTLRMTGAINARRVKQVRALNKMKYNVMIVS